MDQQYENTFMDDGALDDFNIQYWTSNVTDATDFDFDALLRSGDVLGSADSSEPTTTHPFEALPLDIFTTSPSFTPAQSWDLPPAEGSARSSRPIVSQRHSLPRRRSKYILRQSTGRSSPLAIPQYRSLENSSIQPLAMQRWQNSPPEDEAASFSAICNAMERQPSNGFSPRIASPNTDAFRLYRGPSSTTSLDSDASESSIHSKSSNHSSNSRRRSHNSRSRNAPKRKSKDKLQLEDRPFKCTFCCDTFKNKYDWSRHEKSLHLNMEEWICAPYGGAVVSPTTGRVHCAYCSSLDPTSEHLEQHHHNTCQNGQSTPRTFRRKDHLVQHLRLVHGLNTLPLIDDWKMSLPVIKSRCGFCDAQMGTWNERTDHLATHFREGRTMKDWRGEHGFDAEIMQRVTYAFPPYLLAHQAETIIPFSATCKDSIDHTEHLMQQIELLDGTPATSPDLDIGTRPAEGLNAIHEPSQTQREFRVFADVLSVLLSRYAREQMLKGVVPTDEDFQRESRRVFYQDEDEWNQTVADDPAWMKDFRERAGFT